MADQMDKESMTDTIDKESAGEVLDGYSDPFRDRPDYSPLKQIVIDSRGLLALDFCSRIGARPYATYDPDTDGWRAVSVGPWGTTDDGRGVMTAKDISVSESDVDAMLARSRLVQLRRTHQTPLDGFDDVVYYGIGDDSSLWGRK